MAEFMDDLDHLYATGRLDLDRLRRQADARLAQMSALQEKIAGLLGHASTDDERVRVAYSPDAGLVELTIDPRAMRMGSDDLAATIQGLVAAATDDYHEQRRAAGREVLGTDPDTMTQPFGDPAELRDRVGRMSAAFTAAAWESEAFVARMRDRLGL